MLLERNEAHGSNLYEKFTPLRHRHLYLNNIEIFSADLNIDAQKVISSFKFNKPNCEIFSRPMFIYADVRVAGEI